MVLKVIGAIVVIWLAFSLLGFVFKVVFGFLLPVAIVATLGAVGYAAIKGRSERKQIN